MAIKDNTPILESLLDMAQNLPPADFLPAPAAAEPGQIIKVFAVDENGKVTAVEAVDESEGDNPDAVLYTPQTLTEEQKAQARENIGAASASELEQLSGQINGAVTGPTMLFDSDTDAFGDNGFLGNGAPYVDGRHHIPKFDISGEPVTVRIYSYNSNGVMPDLIEHPLWILQFDADGKGIESTRKQFYFYNVNDTGGVGDMYYPDLLRIQNPDEFLVVSADYRGGGIATITPVEGAKYATIFNIFDGVDIDIKVWAGEESVSVPGIARDVAQLQEKVTELDGKISNFQPKYNIVEGNETLFHTVFGNPWGNYHTDFAAVVVSDMHGKFVALDDAAELRDALDKRVVILNAGDNVYQKAKMEGEMNPEVAEYMEKAVKYGVYHTMGQHECGWAWNTSEDGMLKANCMTHDEVFNTFIAPMREAWGLPDLDTIYYYKDFTNTSTGKGARLISLYQYNIPLVDADGDNTRFKYRRSIVWYGQDQLNWLVNTLNSTPDGYKVIILQHALEVSVVNGDEGSNFCEDTILHASDPVLNGAPVFDIVKAYIDKTTLNKTYTPNDTTTYPANLFGITVNANFANAKGEFAHYLSGDAHVDFVGYAQNSKQRHIVLTSCNDSYDCYVKPTANDATRSIVTLLGYDYNLNFARLGRVGQQYAMTGQVRVLEKVKL